jgi:geranylgeranyl reductase family protein
MIETDVCVLGAGPGGVATALELDRLGVACTVVDKAQFPRDKICGDALGGKVVEVLRRVAPALLDRLDGNAEMKVDSWGIRFIAPDRTPIVVPFMRNFDRARDPAPGYIAKRTDFDHLLVQAVQQRSIPLLMGTQIDAVHLKDGAWMLQDAKGGVQISARLVIDASGAQSRFARETAGMNVLPKHYAAAVRGYYRNVAGLDENNFLELHYLKAILPGYLWIFPLPNGQANVGAGMLKSALLRKKVNLKRALRESIETVPALKERFAGAEQLGPIRGFGLPLGSIRRPISGDHYLLVGDAGALIDPLTGEGIGNAMVSGLYAAQQAARALERGDLSAAFLRSYDDAVYQDLGPELRLSRKLQQLACFPVLFDVFARIARRHPKLSEVMSAMSSDIDLRSELLHPSFYAKLLLGRL